MSKYTFYKYQGAGNDFVIFDGRHSDIIDHLHEQSIAQICDRRFGIGGDGLMILKDQDDYDFKMVYYNSDGRPSSMCGNGGRCLVAFAHWQGVIGSSCTFIAVDGPHKANIVGDVIELGMNDVKDIEEVKNAWIIDTGSPHYILEHEALSDLDIIPAAHQIRYNDRFKDEGINVNFCHFNEVGLSMRTYERGVEDETLACGTGATAAAVAYAARSGIASTCTIPIKVMGGELSVRLTRDEVGTCSNIWLCGPGTFVFEGQIELT